MAVPVTVEAAARRSGSSSSTVRRRLTRGRLQAARVETPQGHQWLLRTRQKANPTLDHLSAGVRAPAATARGRPAAPASATGPPAGCRPGSAPSAAPAARPATRALRPTMSRQRPPAGWRPAARHSQRDLVRERTAAGLAAARARGRKGGRPPVLTPQKLAVARQLYDSRQHTVAAIAQTLGVSRASLSRHLRPARPA
jgi:AraC-like DNA-binding protein